MKKILVFTPTLNGGGAERVLMNYLNGLDANKFLITLVLVDEVGVLLDLLPEHVQVLNLKSKKTSLSIFRLAGAIKRIKPDIVYSTLINANIVVYLAVILINSKARVVMRSPNSPGLLYKNKQLGFLQRMLLRLAYKKAHAVIAQTPEMKMELSKYDFVNSEKIRVFMNPLNTSFIDRQSSIDPSPFSNDKINVVASGRLTKQKGFDILISAFKLVVMKNSLYHLHILGDGKAGEMRKLKHQCESLDVVSNVTFHGFQKNPYVYYKNADLYVLSSRWEGMPNTVIENLYLKTPVVATKCVPFLSELIVNGKNGRLVDVGNEEQLATSITNAIGLKVAGNQLDKYFEDVNVLFDID